MWTAPWVRFGNLKHVSKPKPARRCFIMESAQNAGQALLEAYAS